MAVAECVASPVSRTARKHITVAYGVSITVVVIVPKLLTVPELTAALRVFETVTVPVT